MIRCFLTVFAPHAAVRFTNPREHAGIELLRHPSASAAQPPCRRGKYPSTACLSHGGQAAPETVSDNEVPGLNVLSFWTKPAIRQSDLSNRSDLYYLQALTEPIGQPTITAP
jgi:hypothetical protein